MLRNASIAWALLGFLVAGFGCESRSQATESPGKNDLVAECLGKLQPMPKDLQSYRYSAEIETTDTIEARKRRVEDLERLPDVFPPILETARAELQRPDRTFFDVNTVSHSNGCRRIDVEDGFYTTEGQKRVTVKEICTWNGTTCLNFHHALGSFDPPVAMLKDGPSPMSFEGYDYPWKLSGRFVEEMTQAMDERIPVRIDHDNSQDRYGC